MERLIALAVFLILVIGAAAAAGQFTGGEWYQTMHQPSWNPPPIMMAAAWAVLYVLMAVSAWMVWESMRGLARVALGWWVVQLLLGVCWSWMFFGLNRTGWALAVMGLWLLVVLLVIRSFRPIKLEASTLMMPVAGWLLFSWVLGYVQWQLNGGGIATLF